MPDEEPEMIVTSDEYRAMISRMSSTEWIEAQKRACGLPDVLFVREDGTRIKRRVR